MAPRAEEIGWATWRFARACFWLLKEGKIKASGDIAFGPGGKTSVFETWPQVSAMSAMEKDAVHPLDLDTLGPTEIH
jgi:hypothetical protein